VVKAPVKRFSASKRAMDVVVESMLGGQGPLDGVFYLALFLELWEDFLWAVGITA
jgi:hypothetical protein